MNKIQQLLNLLREFVDDDNMTYREKKAAIREEASDDEMTAVEEFASWWDSDDAADRSSD